MKRRTGILIFLFAVAFSAVAQHYYTPFGHNRIQYKRFDWYYYSTNNFEVYYYPGGQEYAQEALSFLEDEFIELTDLLGYAPYTKTKIFIYNSTEDLQQSNIGIGGEVFTIGGKTDFVKLQVEIAYPGKAYDFKKDMINHLSRILINDMMFGGNLAEIFQNSYLLSLPEWFVEGASRYLAYGWSQEMDDYIRDYLARKKINKLVKIQNEEAAIIGQSIWNYIALKYGHSNISNILNLTRIIRNEENSISSTLGVSFKQFLNDWQNYYLLQREEIAQSYSATQEENLIKGYRNKEVVLNHVRLNSDGNQLAYVYHKDGRYRVNVQNLETGKERTVVKGGYLIKDQEIDYNLPLIDWQDSKTLGVLLFKRGYLYLNTYDLETGERLQKPLPRFRQVEGFTFNDNGKLAVISGDVDGKNDLFLIHMRRNALKRITNDLYDDLDPVFIPGTAAIVFSSNRPEDSVQLTTDVTLKDLSKGFNLFLYDLDTTTTAFYRLTNTYSVDRRPLAKNTDEIYYISDQRGISNLYRFSLKDSTFTQVSDYQYSISDFDLSFNGDGFAYLMLDEGRKKVFLEQPYDLSRRVFTPQTARQRLEQARFVAKRLTRPKPTPTPKEEPVVEVATTPDSLVDTNDYQFEEEELTQTSPASEPLIDTDNYVFEDDTNERQNNNAFRPESFFSNYRKLERQSRVIGPQAYEPRFSFNNLITSFAIDPLRGFSILLETEVIDLLENHRMTGGVLTDRNFQSGNLFAEYQYLKYWMDFRIRFDRRSYVFEDLFETNLVQKYAYNKLEVGAAVPLTNAFRLEGSPFYANTVFNNLHYQYIGQGNPNGTFAEDNTVHYAGARVAMVLDNTVEKGFNIYQGTRGMLEVESFLGVGQGQRNFSRIHLDLRHYQKIHRELTLAGRVFYGQSIGNNPQSYLVGGMDNWIFNRSANQGAEDPLLFANNRDNSNVLFARFVTNLRGFDYNAIFGSSAAIFNAELRFPVFEYLSSAPISSNFLRNFQLIGFYDVGSAWSGKLPIKSNSAAFTKKFAPTNSPFSAEIATFQNPWLQSYGFGVRTVLLGYYIKVDVARPIQDFEIMPTRFHFTLGLDF